MKNPGFLAASMKNPELDASFLHFRLGFLVHTFVWGTLCSGGRMGRLRVDAGEKKKHTHTYCVEDQPTVFLFPFTFSFCSLHLLRPTNRRYNFISLLAYVVKLHAERLIAAVFLQFQCQS
ncbi:hypothetical protein L1987_60618 [Smallanthus sonchifolius]|uniref:Uncharacterized protein n=1 Tax=Smallanthus sonchifolius TaxID=185202 RepID=A0ACB9D8L1_9ASTR|nr:hypothetical protein L1987_60618 [Smallanthus sonchifolius]